MAEARRGKGPRFAILTDEISKAWSAMTTRQYKNLKGLKKENLRDNMSDTELVLIHAGGSVNAGYFQSTKPEGFDENVKVAKRGGNVANVARQQLEAETGLPRHYSTECRTAKCGGYRNDRSVGASA